MFSLIGREQNKNFFENFDRISLFFMFIICYYHLHLLVESERDVVIKWVEEDMSLDIFEIVANTSGLAMELVNKELLIFRCYQLNVKNIKCPL
jgi:hypothetical protein